MFTTAHDPAQQATQNQRARMAARGQKFGTPDCYVLQGDPTVSAWIEYKVGTNKPTERQLGRMSEIERCGLVAAPAWDIADVLAILRRAGFRLHGNADNIAVEIQARLDAAGDGVKVRRPTMRAGKPTQRDLGIIARARSKGVFV
jgi:hypothetical protein